MLIKKVEIQILVLGKLFRTNVVSMAIRSYNQLIFLIGNHGNNKNSIKAIFYAYQEGTNNIIGFCNFF